MELSGIQFETSRTGVNCGVLDYGEMGTQLPKPMACHRCIESAHSWPWPSSNAHRVLVLNDIEPHNMGLLYGTGTSIGRINALFGKFIESPQVVNQLSTLNCRFEVVSAVI